MVGGENVGNTELKEKRKKKKRHAEEKRKALAGQPSLIYATNAVCSYLTNMTMWLSVVCVLYCYDIRSDITFADAVAQGDDDGILVEIYDNVQDELRAMKKRYDSEKKKVIFSLYKTV